MEYLQVFISLGIGLLTGFFISFFKEWGKNQALLKDVARLTREKETVTHEYQLDLVRRKHQYESKSNQFQKYFNMLDELHTDAIRTAIQDMQPIMAEFQIESSAAGEDQQRQAAAISKMSHSLYAVVVKMGEGFLKIKYETIGIKLIGNEKTRELLTKLENLYSNYFNHSSEALKEFPTWVINNQQDKIQGMQQTSKEFADDIDLVKEELIKQVRSELDQI